MSDLEGREIRQAMYVQLSELTASLLTGGRGGGGLPHPHLPHTSHLEGREIRQAMYVQLSELTASLLTGGRGGGVSPTPTSLTPHTWRGGR